MYFFIYTKLGVFIWRLRHWKGGGTVCTLHGEEKTQTNSERMTEDCHTRLKSLFGTEQLSCFYKEKLGQHLYFLAEVRMG